MLRNVTKKCFKLITAGTVLFMGFAVINIESRATDLEFEFVEHNEVHVDSFSGLPEDVLDEYVENDIPYSAYVKDNCYFDAGAQVYVFAAKGQTEAIKCSVADGMVVKTPVKISVMQGMDPKLYLNGKLLENPDLENISGKGSYVLRLGEGDNGESILSFKIIGDYSNMEYFNAPEGFAVESVTYNGNLSSYALNEVDLSKEGNVRISYVCSSNGVKYELETNIDHTAPVLELEELNEKFQARGPVDISEIENEPNFGARIVKDGEEIPYTGILTQSGQYSVDVCDEAGNISSYVFTILIYLNVSSLLFIIGVALLIVFLIVYVFVSRKKLRIR